MNPDDDPEARIRQLEQPLADAARASELGGTQPPGYSYPPPPPPTYGSGGIYPAPTSPSSGNRVFWIVAAFFVIGLLILIGGIAAFAAHRFSDGGVVVGSPTTSTTRVRTSPRPIPSSRAPSATVPTVTLTEPTGSSPAPTAGASVTVSGVGETRNIACNNNIVSVSGVSNTVVITGHCARLTVSGVKNSITIDTVDAIEASGLENQVTYHSGSPTIKKSGQSNVVQQG